MVAGRRCTAFWAAPLVGSRSAGRTLAVSAARSGLPEASSALASGAAAPMETSRSLLHMSYPCTTDAFALLHLPYPCTAAFWERDLGELLGLAVLWITLVVFGLLPGSLALWVQLVISMSNYGGAWHSERYVKNGFIVDPDILGSQVFKCVLDGAACNAWSESRFYPTTLSMSFFWVAYIVEVRLVLFVFGCFVFCGGLGSIGAGSRVDSAIFTAFNDWVAGCVEVWFDLLLVCVVLR